MQPPLKLPAPLPKRPDKKAAIHAKLHDLLMAGGQK